MRKSSLYLGLSAAGMIVLGLLAFLHPAVNSHEHGEQLRQSQQLVKELLITDLCLFTEARYTRHLSQADLHAPFQDSPMSMEHFPSGSLVAPPLFPRTLHDEMD
jgi:hypothetical protein